MKNTTYFLTLLFIGLILMFTACEKEESHDDHNHSECCTDTGECCGNHARMAMVDKGYTETEVNPMEKIECYFEEWDKTIMTPVSGLYEYYDSNGTWVASLDYGDGTCDQWVTKTWDVNIFPDNPEGVLEFSLFE